MGDFLLTIGTLFLVVGWIISLFFGFRRRWYWGLLLLFLPVFAHIVFWAKTRKHSKAWAWALPFFGGLGVALLGDGVPVLGALFLIALLVYAFLRYGFKRNPLPDMFSEWSPSFFNTNSVPVTQGAQVDLKTFSDRPAGASTLVEGQPDAIGVAREPIIFSPARLMFVLMRQNTELARWRGSVSPSQIKKALERPELMSDVRSFIAKYLPSAIRSTDPVSVDWSAERCSLFLQMMRAKYGIPEKASAALILYVYDELEYRDYADRFSGVQPKDLQTLMQEAVLSDIYSNAVPNYRYISQVLEEAGIRRVSIQSAQASYQKTREQLRLKQFEKGLHDSTARAFGSVEQEMRTERQLETINQKLSAYLDMSPTAYHIVGPDYSRDSRIDCYYRGHFAYTLSRAFEGHCCKCGAGMAQLEFDHFWLPKASGGNFLMRSKSGLYVNNCIPLCRTCNSSKGSRDARQFFTDDELMRIMERSQSINQYINEHMTDFSDPDFPGRVF